jgi:spore maturation protein CgeB
LFQELRSLRVPLEVYGPGAGDWRRPWRSRRFNAAQVARLYGTHAACLNLPQPGNTERGLNLRAFEVPCAGGVSLYPEVPDLARCFEPGTEMLVYRDAQDIAANIVPLLGNPAKLDEIAAAGRCRVLAEHTFEHRARSILEAIGLG